MLAQTGTLADLSRTDMVAELKATGTRGLLIKSERGFKIQNRRGFDYTARLPEVTEEAKQIEGSYIIDGEIVWFDKRGVTVFLGSQRRCGTSNLTKVVKLKRQYPITFLAFDLLELNEENTRSQPYLKRKHLLGQLIGYDSDKTIRYLPHIAEIKRKMYEDVVADGGEGVILKRTDSIYEDGVRSRDWLKIKQGY